MDLNYMWPIVTSIPCCHTCPIVIFILPLVLLLPAVSNSVSCACSNPTSYVACLIGHRKNFILADIDKALYGWGNSSQSACLAQFYQAKIQPIRCKRNAVNKVAAWHMLLCDHQRQGIHAAVCLMTAACCDLNQSVIMHAKHAFLGHLQSRSLMYQNISLAIKSRLPAAWEIMTEILLTQPFYCLYFDISGVKSPGDHHC